MLSVVMGEFRLSAFFKVFFSLSFHYINDCWKMRKALEYRISGCRIWISLLKSNDLSKIYDF